MIALALLPADAILAGFQVNLKKINLKRNSMNYFLISVIAGYQGENRPRSRRRSNVLWTITTPTGSTPLLQKDLAYSKCLTAQTISWRHGTDGSTNAVEEIT
jgi:hypothetical protein